MLVGVRFRRHRDGRTETGYAVTEGWIKQPNATASIFVFVQLLKHLNYIAGCSTVEGIFTLLPLNHEEDFFYQFLKTLAGWSLFVWILFEIGQCNAVSFFQKAMDK